MKISIFLIFAMTAMFSGCDMEDFVANKVYSDRIGQHDLIYLEEWEDLDTYEKAGKWVKANIRYEADSGSDKWTGPKKTVNNGYGDCEDAAMVFMNIMYVSRGERMDVCLTDMDRHIGVGGKVDHAMPLTSDDRLIDQWSGKEKDWPIAFWYSFDQVFSE